LLSLPVGLPFLLVGCFIKKRACQNEEWKVGGGRRGAIEGGWISVRCELVFHERVRFHGIHGISQTFCLLFLDLIGFISAANQARKNQ